MGYNEDGPIGASTPAGPGPQPESETGRDVAHMVATDTDSARVCPHAFPPLLAWGRLTECDKPAGHRGWHTADDGTVRWSGKLTAAERSLAERLRNTRPGGGDV